MYLDSAGPRYSKLLSDDHIPSQRVHKAEPSLTLISRRDERELRDGGHGVVRRHRPPFHPCEAEQEARPRRGCERRNCRRRSHSRRGQPQRLQICSLIPLILLTTDVGAHRSNNFL